MYLYMYKWPFPNVLPAGFEFLPIELKEITFRAQKGRIYLGMNCIPLGHRGQKSTIVFI
jgi:hypothetical protein